MNIKLLTEQHLEFLSLKGGCKGSSEFTLVKMPQCWKSHVAAHLCKVHWMQVFNTVIYYAVLIIILVKKFGQNEKHYVRGPR